MAGAHEAEFEAYAARDSGRLLGFAVLLAGDRQDAEDLVQLALLRSAGRWPAARQHPEGYTRAVLVNLARDRWRVRRRRYPETLAGNLAQLSPAASAAVSGLPPYYVTADHGRPVAEVRDSATGKALSVVLLPGGIDPKMSQAAAAGNDRTFVLALFLS